MGRVPRQERHDEEAYQNGRLAWLRGIPKEDCPHGQDDMTKRFLWIGGWNDIDDELRFSA